MNKIYYITKIIYQNKKQKKNKIICCLYWINGLSIDWGEWVRTTIDHPASMVQEAILFSYQLIVSKCSKYFMNMLGYLLWKLLFSIFRLSLTLLTSHTPQRKYVLAIEMANIQHRQLELQLNTINSLPFHYYNLPLSLFLTRSVCLL